MLVRGSVNLRQRVVITGLGVISPCGLGKEDFWKSVVEGRSGIDWLEGFDTSDLYCKIGGQIKHFNPHDYVEKKDCLRGGRFSHFAVAASRLALSDAGLDDGHRQVDPLMIGTVFGTSTAGRYEGRGVEEGEVSVGLEMEGHAATSHVAIEFGLRGPNTTSAAGCVSSLDVMGTACGVLQAGAAQVMIAGATDTCISRLGISTLCSLRVMTAHNDPPQAASRPYDDTRDGLVLSEGAGAVVLERADHALERGAHIYGEMAAYASVTEGQHLVKPQPSGEELAHAFRTALLMGKIGPDEVDYVCAHGIGNRHYDLAETNAVKQVLGERAYNVPMSSIKGTTGQPFAPGGCWQLVAACLSMERGMVPPTLNYRVPDPECDLDYVPNRARRARVDTVMINSHSFGGTHGCLLVRRFAA